MPAPDLPGVSKQAHQAMGTTFEVLITGSEASYAGAAAQAVFDEIDRLESHLSRFNPGGDLGRINRLEPGESLAVGIEVFECLSLAEKLRKETSGAFDIRFRSRMQMPAHGSSDSGGTGTIQTSPRYSLSRDGFRFLVTRFPEPENRTSGRLELDPGGIGKGFALDYAARVLDDWDIRHALVHGGTSTALARGDSPGNEARGWPVGLGRSRECSEAPDRLWLKDEALSGSGMEVKGCHIFDPRSGAGARGHVAAWVRHPSAAVADALSTAFMVMEDPEVENFCSRYPDIWTLVMSKDRACRIFES